MTRGGRKVGGGGKSRTNKDHRGLGLKKRIDKNRWDDICAEELSPLRVGAMHSAETQLDTDKPGLGQFYCVSCARYYISAAALAEHSATKKHRRRLKMLTTEKPYSHAEANIAAGRGGAETTGQGVGAMRY